MNDTKELERKSISRVSMSLVSLLLFRKGKENYERNAVKKNRNVESHKENERKKKGPNATNKQERKKVNNEKRNRKVAFAFLKEKFIF